MDETPTSETDTPSNEQVPILLVDDIASNLLALEVALASPAHRLVSVQSGSEALALIQAGEFAAVLLDVHMPGMDGFEVARRIRALKQSRPTPIIFVTARGTDSAAVERAYELGAVDYLSKPIDLPVLLAKTKVFVDLYKAQREVRRQGELLRKQERFEHQQVLETALDAVIGVDHHDHIIDWNIRAETIFGWKSGDVMGKRMRELIIPERFRADHLRGMQHYVQTGASRILNRRIEVVAVRKNGSEFPAELSVTPIRTSGGYKFYSFLRDLTERHRSERELQMKSDALENSLNGFDIVDSQGRFLYVNRAYLKMWGYSHADEVLGTSALGHCEDQTVPARIVESLKSTGECNIEFVARRKDGSTFDVHMWARLAHDSEGREIYPSTSIDITEQKSILKRLDSAIRVRDEFLSIASHELRTPLTPMKLQIQSLGLAIDSGRFEMLTPDRLRKIVNQSDKQLTRLTALIEDLLDVTRISSGKLRLNLETEDLCAVVHEVCDRYSVQAQTSGVEIRIDACDRSLATFDRLRIEQVLINLLTNAMKYAPGKPVDVTVREHPHGFRVAVRDQGDGIAPEDLAKIFERFERVQTPTSTAGLGLGLYISRQIVESHGGRLWAESELGGGTQFEFEIPRTPTARTPGH